MSTGKNKLEKVVVHPLVLLSVTDHYTRVGKTGAGRVVGILLGTWTMGGRELDISNSFALPFDEDSKDRDIWFLDHDYLDTMFTMFKKVNARERIVGWYHTGPKLKANDMKIHELIQKHMPAGHDATLTVIDVAKTDNNTGLPTEAYVAEADIRDDGKPAEKTWRHISSAIGAEEAEEVGVEQLLRDVYNPTAGSLSQKISAQLASIRGLHGKLEQCYGYLTKVVDGKLPPNHQVLYNLQDALSLVPDLIPLTKSFHMETHDQLLPVYLASLVRSIVALHGLINNKLQNSSDIKPKPTTEKPSTESDKPAVAVK
ncbi:Oidioi.mRNA.OKI2018_I69.XSR.g15004.t1.cds [Oikopleura dioica]|uniref:Oidioi.mRNA.OKI2018_I69.XSR.g15004.t1.cds n=1 Tax=Oikopleura dioica TaxID=34765 RepID=A0ABN7SGI5_OIKDI|nr:Oidioi.mRNA.OKI2018_I69.XSR.g15004.t1.cds [Oikopleura dioica]